MAKRLKGSPPKVAARLLVKSHKYPSKRRLAVEIKKGRVWAYKLRPHWYYNLAVETVGDDIHVVMKRSWSGQGRFFYVKTDKQGRLRYEVGRPVEELPTEFAAGTSWYLCALPGSTAEELRFQAIAVPDSPTEAEEPLGAEDDEAAGDEPEPANPSPAPAPTALEQALAYVAATGCRLGKGDSGLTLIIPEGHAGVPRSIVKTLSMHRGQLSAVVLPLASAD